MMRRENESAEAMRDLEELFDSIPPNASGVGARSERRATP